MDTKRFIIVSLIAYFLAFLGYCGSWSLVNGTTTSKSPSPSPTATSSDSGTNFNVQPNVGFSLTVSGPSTAYVGPVPVFNRFVGNLVNYDFAYLLTSTLALFSSLFIKVFAVREVK